MRSKLFKWKHYEKDIILICVRRYLKCALSYRDLVEIMAERGIIAAYTTIMRWVHQYSPIIETRIRKHVNLTSDSWRMDETYIRIKGENAYLYRSVDSKGDTIDFLVSEKRNKNAGRRFFKKSAKM